MLEVLVNARKMAMYAKSQKCYEKGNVREIYLKPQLIASVKLFKAPFTSPNSILIIPKKRKNINPDQCPVRPSYIKFISIIIFFWIP